MEPVGPKGQNDPFSRIPMSFVPIKFIDVREDLDMEPVALDGQNAPFSMSNEPWSSWSPRPKRTRFQGQMNLIILDMESVGPDGQNGPFSRSNEP
ncbi:hypothetical protein H5410_031964 [Solanum commersonii]|uniref:Uncharacterized protein n=1 Tax=Solanum commersonii TaxID=4109 RepID=A0A9J5YJQ3_SOLCO|nr:hypothetical protein H5410_031964 [Solanum commersonii]